MRMEMTSSPVSTPISQITQMYSVWKKLNHSEFKHKFNLQLGTNALIGLLHSYYLLTLKTTTE